MADSQTLFREGLILVLKGGDEQVRGVEAIDFSGTLRAGEEHGDLRLILIDFHLPGMEGWAGIKTLRHRLPDIPVAVMSPIADYRHVRASMKSGAVGYIPKTLSSKVLTAALNLIFSGGVYLPPESLYDDYRFAGADWMRADGASSPPELTRRQTDVVKLLAEGLSNKEIGQRLSLSEGTIKLHITALLKKFQANNRTQVVIKAIRLGVTPDQVSVNPQLKTAAGNIPLK
ncbi:MAG: response regulator transcription factor [Rhodospirillales bacterium]|nr:response regulator transcription factor [Rhodospirillales bacterium]MDP6882614.1 response regulator transcription factor [Rhodospirillales bacterium]